ncbi:MAG: CPBP family intramembrane metalloprotease [Acidimicrobiia bacterium]|nr:CPBP family intramembrane metalloprotease [Acidimicrobiia bacterium]MDH4308101.1 CPBP family intramembrane metalloprotease [Acidimicrobiia bacterium]MDH5292597.1 CPBP family intramembrane metalloprotease [Acidimicrobiia bacterium]
MTPTLTDSGRTETGTSWLGKHPIAGSAVIAALTGVALQLTHMIDFQERVAALVGWNLSVRFVDFGFRMALGAVVVLELLPWLFGYMRSRTWFRGYLRRLCLTSGPAPRFTLSASAASVAIMAALIGGLAARFDVLRLDLDFVLDDSRWFIVILALVPALWEELAFRGLMLTNLQQRHHRWIAIVTTALFFGLFHISNLLLRDFDQVIMEMIMAAAFSIGWGYAVVKTGSVVPAMVSHYGINVFIGLLLAPELSDSAGAAIFGSLTLAYPILTVIAVWLLGRRHRAVPSAAEFESRPIGASPTGA